METTLRNSHKNLLSSLLISSFLLLHTYLVEVGTLMNVLHCDTSPPLHIGATRIVDFPSGTSSAEFLIAIISQEKPRHLPFHWDLGFMLGLEEELLW